MYLETFLSFFLMHFLCLMWIKNLGQLLLNFWRYLVYHIGPIFLEFLSALFMPRPGPFYPQLSR